MTQNLTDFAIDVIGRILVSGNSNNLYRSYDTLITDIGNINGRLNEMLFLCYPNPYKNSTSIISKTDKWTSLIIYDSCGHIVDATSLEPFETYLLKEALPSGLYFAVLLAGYSRSVFKIIHY